MIDVKKTKKWEKKTQKNKKKVEKTKTGISLNGFNVADRSSSKRADLSENFILFFFFFPRQAIRFIISRSIFIWPKPAKYFAFAYGERIVRAIIEFVRAFHSRSPSSFENFLLPRLPHFHPVFRFTYSLPLSLDLNLRILVYFCLALQRLIINRRIVIIIASGVRLTYLKTNLYRKKRLLLRNFDKNMPTEILDEY